VPDHSDSTSHVYARQLLGNLPNSWRYAQIGGLEQEGIIAEIQDGNHGEKHPKSSDYVPFGVPFIMARDLADGQLDLAGCNYITHQQADGLRIGFAKPGDVLLTHKATMGRVAIVPEDYDYIMLTPQVTYYRIGDQSRLNNLYLKYAFLSPTFQHQLNATSDQSTRKYIGITAQRDLWLPLPPISEQKAIAHILGTLDDKIDLNRRMNETLEAIARAIFKSWFIDFDPVIDKALAAGNPIPAQFARRAAQRKALGDRRKTLPPDIAALFPNSFDESELGLIPKGWCARPLSEVVLLIAGGTPKTSVDEYWDGSIPWFSISDAPPDGNVFVIDTEKHVTELGIENSSTRILEEKMTIISARGTVGKCALVGRPMALNQSCYGIKGAGGIGDYFTYYLIRSQIADLQKSGHGSVFNTITRSTFESIKIADPGVKLSITFDNHIGSLFRRILSNQYQDLTLSKLRDTLLPRLLSGEIIVPVAKEKERGEEAKRSFLEAVLLTSIIKWLVEHQNRATRLRTQKTIYFTLRRMGLDVTKSYTRHELGPYNPKMRYRGGERLAIKEKYIKKSGPSEFALGPNESKALKYLYADRKEAIEWVLNYLGESKEEVLELMSTVDYAAIELNEKGIPISVDSVVQYIASEPEWATKLNKPHFTRAKIETALKSLSGRFDFPYKAV